MGGIAVCTAMPKGGLKTRPYSVNGTININLALRNVCSYGIMEKINFR